MEIYDPQLVATIPAIDPATPGNSTRATPVPENARAMFANPGSGDPTARQAVPAAQVAFSVTRTVWNSASDPIQILNPADFLQGEPIYFNGSAATIRAELNNVPFGVRMTFVNSSASTTILDPGVSGSIVGVQALNVTGGELTIKPGESATLTRISGSIFYLVSLRELPSSFNASTYSWFRRADGRYDLVYPNVGISAAASTTITLPSPFNVAALYNGSGHSVTGDASIFVSPFRQSATAASSATTFDVYNVLQGSLGGGTAASVDIKNLSTGTARFHVLFSGLTLADAPRLSAASRITASLRLMPAGQSLADFMTYGPSGYTLRTTLYTALGSGVLPNKVGIIDAAAGGSAINKSAAAVGSTNYWVDDTGALADGPVLTTALAAIAALPAGEQPHAILWDQGQQDSGLARTDPTYAAGGYTTSTLYALNKLRTAIAAAGGPATIPIFWMKVGRSFSDPGGAGYRRIRKAQRAMIAGGTAIYDVPEVYGVELKDSVHPSYTAGQIDYGNRFAAAILRAGISGVFAADSTQKLGPTANVTRPNASTIQIAITSESGDTATVPDSPFGIVVEDAGGTAVPFTVSRAGSTYTLALTGAPGPVTVAYPILPLGEFYTARLPKGGTSGFPLRSFEVALA